MAAVQEISARVGRVTGRGIAGNLRKFYPAWLLNTVVGLLLVANVINIGADLGAMGSALKLLIGGPSLLYVAGFAIISCCRSWALSFPFEEAQVSPKEGLGPDTNFEALAEIDRLLAQMLRERAQRAHIIIGIIVLGAAVVGMAGVEAVHNATTGRALLEALPLAWCGLAAIITGGRCFCTQNDEWRSWGGRAHACLRDTNTVWATQHA